MTPNIGIFLRLVECGVDIRADSGMCIRSASSLGRLEIIKRLVSLGVDIDDVYEGCSYWAAFHGHYEIDWLLASYVGSGPRAYALATPPYALFRNRMKVKARVKAARKIYFCSTYGWVSRGYDLARRSGRRMRARNFRDYRRLGVASN